MSFIEILEKSFEKIKPQAEEFVASFYENLFKANPEVKPLFAKTDMSLQQKKLLQSLVLVVENLRNPAALGAVLENLGARHVGYGAVPKQYGAVGTALLLTFEQYLQEDWTPEVKEAWQNAFTAIAQQMLKGVGVESTTTKIVSEVKVETPPIPAQKVTDAIAPPTEQKLEEIPNSESEPLPIELLESSFEKIKPQAEEFVASFYENLFKAHPEVKPLFAKTDMSLQQKKLLQSLVLVVENLRNPAALGAVLENLGARHVGYGAIPKQYGAVGTALLMTFEQYLQEDWTPEVKQAWQNAFTTITQQMLKGAGAESVSMPKVVSAAKEASIIQRPVELIAPIQKEYQQFQPQAAPEKKALISIQLDEQILKETINNFTVKYQQFKTKISQQPFSEVLKKIPGQLIKSFWILPTWAIATGSAVIMAGVFVFTDDNSMLGEILGGVDAISMVVALVLFIKEAPDRRKQFHYQAWSTVDAAQGVKVSYARILALQDLNEDGVSLRGLDTPGAELVEVNLSHANLSKSNLMGSDFTNANLSYANLDNANLSQVKLSGADLNHAKLGFANLNQANLSSANLSHANLICADLSQANLSGANLRNASLSGANLQDAYLSGANLKGAQVSIVELSGAFLEGTIMPDGSKNKSS